MDVISEMMGVPEEDRAEVRRQADIVVHREDGVYDVPPPAMDSSLWLVGYYQDMVNQRRRRPSDDLTSALIEAEVDGERLTDEDVIAFLFLMVVAGNETTTKLLGHALFHLTRHPDQLAKVFDGPDPELVNPWIEETLRFDTSSQLLARYLLRTWSCTARSRRRARSCCSASARPTATSGSSAAPTTTTSSATRTSSRRSCPSAAAGTSASAPTWPGSRPGSR